MGVFYLSYGCFAEEDQLDAAAGLGRVGRWRVGHCGVCSVGGWRWVLIWPLGFSLWELWSSARAENKEVIWWCVGDVCCKL